MDLIAAVATGSSAGAIGIVRLSGDGCFAACDRVFRPLRGPALSAAEPRRMIYGDVLDAAGAAVDRGLAVRFPAPHSYTGEDCAEFDCHGSPAALRELLSALFAAGARQARAGEFTRRAFLNGRMDLTEAEAVIDLIDAPTAAAARNAAAQLNGALGRRLGETQETLLELISRFGAVVDYPDEDIADIRPEELLTALDRSGQSLRELLSTAERGRVLKRGARTVLAGRPNVGKSSLLNALAGRERAIVTDVPGTTRDTVEEAVLCGGVLLRLIDTAGIRDTEDAVEKLGVACSRRALADADLVLAVLDADAGETEADREILELAAACPRWLLVWSKADLCAGAPAPRPDWSRPGLRAPDAEVLVSAVTGEGLPELAAAAAALFPAGAPDEAGALLTDARQEDAVRRALTAVERAAAAARAGMTPDAVLTDAEEALSALGELTGRTVREDIVERIFSRFCVGK